MEKPKANPMRSEGARIERRAIREYLRRCMKHSDPAGEAIYGEVLQWVLRRQKRYDKKDGGLGR